MTRELSLPFFSGTRLAWVTTGYCGLISCISDRLPAMLSFFGKKITRIVKQNWEKQKYGESYGDDGKTGTDVPQDVTFGGSHSHARVAMDGEALYPEYISIWLRIRELLGDEGHDDKAIGIDMMLLNCIDIYRPELPLKWPVPVTQWRSWGDNDMVPSRAWF